MRWLLAVLIVANIVAFVWRDFVLSVMNGPKQFAGLSATSQWPTIALLDEKITSNNPEKSKQPAIESKTKKESKQITETDQLCWFIGADNTVSDSVLPKLGNRFTALDINAELINVEVVSKVRHLVYMHTEGKDQQAALPLLQKFLAEGYDAYFINSGNLKGAIAFGNYANKTAAERVIARLGAEGVEVSMEVLNDYESQLRLMMTEAEHRKLSDKLWGRLRLDWPEIFKEKKYCESVAR